MAVDERVLMDQAGISIGNLYGWDLAILNSRLRACPELLVSEGDSLKSEAGQLLKMNMGQEVQVKSIIDSEALSLTRKSIFRLRYGRYVTQTGSGRMQTLWKHSVVMSVEEIERRLDAKSLIALITTMKGETLVESFDKGLENLRLESELEELDRSLEIEGRHIIADEFSLWA